MHSMKSSMLGMRSELGMYTSMHLVIKFRYNCIDIALNYANHYHV